jgi:ATP-binding cassette subfamily B protein
MILDFYGLNYSYSKLRELCEIDNQGLSLYDISNCFRKVDFISKAIIINQDKLYNAPLPLILYWNESHYVVVYEINKKKKRIYIADPAYGGVSIKIDDFQNYVADTENIIAIIVHPPTNIKKVREDKVKSKNIYSIYRYITLLIKRHKVKLIFSMLLLIIASIFNWFIPVILQKIIDKGILQYDFDRITLLFLFQFSIYMGFLFSNTIGRILIQKMNFNISISILSEYLYKLFKIPLKIFDLNLKTDYIQRLEDQTTIQNYSTNQLIDSVLSFLNVIVFASILLYYSTISFFFFLFFSLFSFVWIKVFWIKRKIFNYQRFHIVSENQNSILEMINGMKDIKINNAEELKISHWKILRDRLNNIAMKNVYINNSQNIGNSVVNILRDISINVYVSYSVINSNMTLGEMMGIGVILSSLSASFNQIINNLSLSQDAVLAAKRLSNILQENDEGTKQKKILPDIQKKILFSSVYFKYQNKHKDYVLKDINLNIPTGEVTAIVGASGCGKTTLIKLLLSLYHPQKGSVIIDNIHLSEIDINSWHKLCGVVLQDGYIFGGNIVENIALGEKLPNFERIVYSSKVACAYDFINALPLKFKTKIGSSGMELSMGQKQRILIARAVYKDPALLILDEATSFLDAKNEYMVYENLKSFFKGKTVITIAHRLSTVRHADHIVVLDKGNIIETGNHDELISKCGFYYELIKKQLN